ncbi:hypothetical protein HG530_014850 [Fusarium avenaceum]|nr:hypothetical protein HG530_014850 [Fusarium avenaceum]
MSPVSAAEHTFLLPEIIRDFNTSRETQQLELKIHRLERLLASTPQSGGPVNETSPRTGSPRYVGPESGAGFFESTLRTHYKWPNPESTVSSSQQNQPLSTICNVPHSFPPLHLAEQAIGKYFQEFHHAHPFLDRDRVYESLNRQASPTISPEQINKHHLFQLNMVLAIGSIRLYREGATALHPFGFFMAALKANPPSSSSFSTLEDIENLLLIAWFGTFYNIGCSLWDLGRLCIRMAIELNLHRKQATPAMENAGYVQRCLRVFWDSYLLDRLSSCTLGRPFALEDNAIEAGLPENGDHATNLRAFSWLVSLSQTTSRIHCSMDEQRCITNNDAYQPLQTLNNRSTSRMRKMYALLRRFQTEMKALRETAPSSENPTSIYEAEDFFELSYQERRLCPFEPMLSQAACGIINSFSKLKDANLITFTRPHMHSIFIASLVVVAIKHAHESGACQEANSTSSVDLEYWLDGLSDGSCTEAHTDSVEVIRKARDILSWLATGMPDLAIYARVFSTIEQDLGTSNCQNDQQECPTDGQARSSNTRIRQQAVSGSAQSPSRRYPFGRREDCELPDMNGSIEPTILGFNETLDIALNEQEVLGIMQHEYVGLQATNNVMWPLSDFFGAENLDPNLSNFVWDITLPWDVSPTTL